MNGQAWCPGCRTMVLPHENGSCLWCDTKTVLDREARDVLLAELEVDVRQELELGVPA